MKRAKRCLFIIIVLLLAVSLFMVASSSATAAMLRGEAQWHNTDEKFSVTADIVMPSNGRADGYIKYNLRKNAWPDISGAWCFPADIIATTNVRHLVVSGDGGPGSMAVAAGPVSAIYDPADQALEWLVLFVKKGADGSCDQIRVFFASEGDARTPGTARYFCANPTAAAPDPVHSGNFTLRP